MNYRLPLPDASAQTHSKELVRRICQEIEIQGYISFSRYMELALYTPQLGYYSNHLQKIGKDGDFITAPETSVFFGQCIAQQIQQALSGISNGSILEFGAGSGRLAADILMTLDNPPTHYYILELSANLRARQQQYLKDKLPHYFSRIIWLDSLPAHFQGVILANEVIDAMPVDRFYVQAEELQESIIRWENDQLYEDFRPARDELCCAITQLGIEFSPGYLSEINLRLPAWLASLADMLTQGIIVLIDYGYSQSGYYHPERNTGTLMCHYQHRAHPDPLFWPGIQDITTHVDFTRIAEAAVANGLDVAGYTTQAHFLINCNLLTIAADLPDDSVDHYHRAQQLKKLLLPSAMGESFKVMALSKNLDIPLMGFATNDLSERL